MQSIQSWQIKSPGNNPVLGLGYLLSSLHLLLRPGIKRFVLIPLLINILIFMAALAAGWHYFGSFMDSMLDFSGLWEWVQSLLNMIRPLLWILFFSAYLIFVFYTFSILANIIAAPFNSLLAEATEAYLRGTPVEESTSMLQLLKDIIPMIWQELVKLWYFVIRALPLLILFLIPLTTAIAPVLWFLFSAWMMSLQYMDYPMGNHQLKFKQQRELQTRQRWFSLGFGSAVLIGTMIPVINFMIMPAAVVGATRIWVEKFEAK